MNDMEDEKRRGNPVINHRFRVQSHLKENDEPMESEWTSYKEDAIKMAVRWVIRNYNKFGNDDTVMKIYNEMNYKKPPVIITLQDAFKLAEKMSYGNH